MYEAGGIDSIEVITNIVLIFLAFLFMVSVLHGYLEGNIEPNPSLQERVSEYFSEIEDEDIYAIVTGDEEYLAAHCTLKEEPLPVTKTRLNLPLEQDSNSKHRRAKTKRKVNSEQAKPKQVKPCTTDVGREAAMGLVSLGYKKSDANRLVNDILTNNPNMTSDQIVMEVFNK